MARGTPVLATGVGGVPDLVAHEKTGYLLDDASPDGILRAVRRVLADPRLGEVAEAGRALVAREHSLAAAAARYREALRTYSRVE
jgi:glycosyltransferase involved in cell wall biosynthesis